MAKRKLLILTYYWPPAGGAGVQRWLKFVKYLSKMDYEIHVFTTENPEAPATDDSLLDDIPNNVKVVKSAIWEPFSIYKKLTNKKEKFNAGFLSEEKKNKKSWAEKISMFVRANLFIPDAKMLWIRPSTRILKRYIKEHNIDIIISSGPPHSLHIIALKVKKALGVKWLADFRDPWTNIDFYQKLPMLSLVDKRQHFLEKKVLEKADKIIVIGEEMKKEFLEIQPKADVHIITNGYDSQIRTNVDLYDDFHIIHIGSINADRSHESFYKAVANFLEENPSAKKHFRIKLIGKVDFVAREYISQYKLDPFVELISYLPYNQIAEIQEKAHILYLPINNTPNAKGILTGKFFEYLAAKRFILAQGPLDGDIAKILKNTCSGFICNYSDIDGIQSAIVQQYQLYIDNNNDFESNQIEKYSRENLTKKLATLIDSIV